MSRCASKNKEVPVDHNGENKVDPDDGAASVSSSGTHPSETGTFKCINSVNLSSQSSRSQKLSSRSSGSSGSSSSSGQSRDFTKEMYSRLMESSDKWLSLI